MTKPFSQSCENNKQAILSVLNSEFIQPQRILEIGTGSAQHAVYFAAKLPHLTWQTSDLACNHAGINCWLDSVSLTNLQRPLLLDLHQPWPIEKVDGIFTANTLHIVSWPLVKKFFQGVGEHLSLGGKLCIYGPFNYMGKFTSQSNADFDVWLKDLDAERGIRNIEAISKLAIEQGLTLIHDHTMPANNRLLVFVRS
ncbi:MULTISPECIES: DUF938 domain-containing protein [unclassified Moritella]|uniref:DUF938 domain-containing protein n=1 Tax=unclassified Moritella TaxID=2637987 RepID=UPI001BA5EDFD|nr:MULTISPECIES: DUF938 domain-containing protein [unclassified Moritella]QUM85789.1 DUF938 domain-containing protein [Moritella sp. 28]QUM90014.1 DUF938 domain-containing protein [Moritella sp. 36]